MSINIPNKDQWEKMNKNLFSIASALGTQIDVSSWAGVQKAVRAGVAPDLFPVGTQFLVNHSLYGEHLYDVVAHDHYKSAHDENAHTMTLLSHDLIADVRFDGSEAFYYAESELPAGAYRFTLASPFNGINAGSSYFTLTKALPKGGQLCIDWYPGNQLSMSHVTSYASSTATTPIETVSTFMGNMGKSLGTFGVELNHVHRVLYGSNNYKESALRQYLNSSAEAGAVWTPKTKFDRPVDIPEGYLRRIDPDFLSVIGEVIVPCAANDIYESPDSTAIKNTKYTVTDKFYLPSHMEVFGNSTDGVVDDSVLFPFFDGATDVDRVKYGSWCDGWWLRSVISGDACSAMYVDNGGVPNYEYVGYELQCAPVCNIV